MKLSKQIKQSDLRTAVELLERGRKAMARQEWEKGETQEEWKSAVGTFFAWLEASMDYENETEKGGAA